MTRAGGPDGILLVDKPAGATSAGVVRQVKRLLGGVKVGHLGTLDPFATGLLPLCVGEGSKIVPFLNQKGKAYEGRIRLGRETDTLDASGKTTAEAAVPEGIAERLSAVARQFTGTIEQTPPMYSAVKRGGVPLYRLARKGIRVERRPRAVEIHSLDLVESEPGSIDLEVECSKGTYVRVLAAEIAAALGTRGHLSTLRRTRFGVFRVGNATPPESIDAHRLELLSLRDALPEAPEIEVDARVEADLRTGRQGALSQMPALAEFGRAGPEKVAKILNAGRLVALVGVRDRRWRILRVINRG